ncbi:MAG: cell division protein ZapA [Verrucomicrobia bacterium]|nr:cell division protein ZapA [Verrucomicrobiota bacterium]|tara:strand:+ start:308 stop:592 length:285 start_codon:yes stop_codon:yes gene_type:complete
MKDLSIKVNIAGRIYPMTVKQEEEEGIRKAVKAIDKMIKDYEQNYSVRDKQDLLAMSALHFATQSMVLEEKTIIEDTGVIQQLEALDQLLEERL